MDGGSIPPSSTKMKRGYNDNRIHFVRYSRTYISKLDAFASWNLCGGTEREHIVFRIYRNRVLNKIDWFNISHLCGNN